MLTLDAYCKVLVKLFLKIFAPFRLSTKEQSTSCSGNWALWCQYLKYWHELRCAPMVFYTSPNQWANLAGDLGTRGNNTDWYTKYAYESKCIEVTIRKCEIFAAAPWKFLGSVWGQFRGLQPNRGAEPHIGRPWFTDLYARASHCAGAARFVQQTFGRDEISHQSFPAGYT